jgi:hypothetical protein
MQIAVPGLHVPEASRQHESDPAASKEPKARVVIAYATVSGTTEEYARAVAKLLQASNVLEVGRPSCECRDVMFCIVCCNCTACAWLPDSATG